MTLMPHVKYWNRKKTNDTEWVLFRFDDDCNTSDAYVVPYFDL